MIKNLDKLYNLIDTKSRKEILSGHEFVDPKLSLPNNDHRFGITLLIPLSGKTLSRIKNIQEQIAKIEPYQYFYPQSDLHITVIDLISAHDKYKRDKKQINKLRDIVQKASVSIAPFTVSFKGIIASKVGILAKGFYRTGLYQIRMKIREFATEEGFKLAERYQSISAHASIIRFKTSIDNKPSLLKYLDKTNSEFIGNMQVHEMDLVIHDWYNCRKENIGKFILK